MSVHDLQKCKDCGDTIKTLVEKLSSAFLVNAVFGQQIQKLFVGTKDEVLGSIMYLSQKPSSYSFSLSLLEDRLKIEKEKSTPDTDIVIAIVQTKRDLDDNC